MASESVALFDSPLQYSGLHLAASLTKHMKLSHISPRHAVVVVALPTGLLSSCATRPIQPITGYTCCNLRPNYGRVSSTNMLGDLIVPAGEPAVLDTMKRDTYFYGTIGGDYISLRDACDDQVDFILRNCAVTSSAGGNLPELKLC